MPVWTPFRLLPKDLEIYLRAPKYGLVPIILDFG